MRLTSLWAGAALHLDLGPALEGLAQPAMAVDNEQRRRNQPAPLQVEQDTGPVAGCLTRGQPQRDQHLRGRPSATPSTAKTGTETTRRARRTLRWNPSTYSIA